MLTQSNVVLYLKVERLCWLRGRLLGRPLPRLVSSLNIKHNILKLLYASLGMFLSLNANTEISPSLQTLVFLHRCLEGSWGQIQRKTWWMGSYAGVDYNLTLMSTSESTPTHLPWATVCQSRHWPYARVDFIPQGTLDLALGNNSVTRIYLLNEINSKLLCFENILIRP